MKKVITLALAAILAAAMFAACSGSGSPRVTASSAAPMSAPAFNDNSYGGFGEKMSAQEDAAMYDEAEDYEMAAPSETGGGIAGPTVTPVLNSRKIIKNVYMDLQTLTFDSGVDEISKAAESYGGYVQDSYVEGRDMYNTRGTRTARLTLRIPSEQLDMFVNALGGQFNVISKSQNSQDITDSYFDSKARLESLRVQEERLLSMLKEATELEYLITVEEKLMNVRYEIESLTSSLNRMDSYVSLSTVNVNLYEVVKYEPVENTPVTFGERIARAFAQSWVAFSEFSQDCAVMLVEALPFLLLIAVFVIIIVAVAKRHNKKRQINRAQTEQLLIKQNAQNTRNTNNTPDKSQTKSDENQEQENK